MHDRDNSHMILHVRKWHFAPWSAPAASRLSAARGTTMIANETFRCVMYGIMSVTLQSVVWQISAQLTRTVWQSHVGWGRHDNTCPRSFYCLALLFCDPSTGNSKRRVRFFFLSLRRSPCAAAFCLLDVCVTQVHVHDPLTCVAGG